MNIILIDTVKWLVVNVKQGVVCKGEVPIVMGVSRERMPTDIS